MDMYDGMMTKSFPLFSMIPSSELIEAVTDLDLFQLDMPSKLLLYHATDTSLPSGLLANRFLTCQASRQSL